MGGGGCPGSVLERLKLHCYVTDMGYSEIIHFQSKLDHISTIPRTLLSVSFIQSELQALPFFNLILRHAHTCIMHSHTQSQLQQSTSDVFYSNLRFIRSVSSIA